MWAAWLLPQILILSFVHGQSISVSHLLAGSRIPIDLCFEQERHLFDVIMLNDCILIAQVLIMRIRQASSELGRKTTHSCTRYRTDREKPYVHRNTKVTSNKLPVRSNSLVSSVQYLARARTSISLKNDLCESINPIEADGSQAITRSSVTWRNVRHPFFERWFARVCATPDSRLGNGWHRDVNFIKYMFQKL